MLGQELGDQVGAVVHGDLRLVVNGRCDVRVVGGVVFTFDGVGGDSVVFYQRGGYFVLGGERIGAAEDYVCAAVTQGDREVRGLAGDVQTGGHADALQGLVFDELFAD